MWGANIDTVVDRYAKIVRDTGPTLNWNPRQKEKEGRHMIFSLPLHSSKAFCMASGGFWSLAVSHENFKAVVVEGSLYAGHICKIFKVSTCKEQRGSRRCGGGSYFPLAQVSLRHSNGTNPKTPNKAKRHVKARKTSIQENKLDLLVSVPTLSLLFSSAPTAGRQVRLRPGTSSTFGLQT